MGTPQDLNVRSTARHDIALPARVEIAPEHRSVVGLERSRLNQDGKLECMVVDAGVGGLGLLTEVFLPRRSLLIVRAYSIDEAREVLEATVRVQRVVMTDRRPAYLIGTAFEQANAAMDRAIDGFFAELAGA
ncbi:MAG: hypothetical protein AAGG07_12950 [Planctomycetota bacterium]